MANESFSKIQEAITRTTAAIGVKTSVFVGSAKVKTQIGTLKNEIHALELDLGKTVYESWIKGEIETDHEKELCIRIKEKYDNIEMLEQEIVRLEQQEEEVLGAKKADGGAAQSFDKVNDRYTCPSCSAVFDSPTKFCRNCGTKMM